jgi:4a-hydroxytetrahydrobiopterin dehydratase
LTASRIGIARTYRFKTFKAAWSFMNLVAAECQKQRHHPSWHNLYNEVSIEWTTHRPRGLSEKDVQMAGFCERVAGEVGVMLRQENISSSTDGTTKSSKGAAGMSVGVGSGAGAGSANDARGDRVVQQKRALHIPAHAIAAKLRRRFE